MATDNTNTAPPAPQAAPRSASDPYDDTWQPSLKEGKGDIAAQISLLLMNPPIFESMRHTPNNHLTDTNSTPPYVVQGADDDGYTHKSGSCSYCRRTYYPTLPPPLDDNSARDQILIHASNMSFYMTNFFRERHRYGYAYKQKFPYLPKRYERHPIPMVARAAERWSGMSRDERLEILQSQNNDFAVTFHNRRFGISNMLPTFLSRETFVSALKRDYGNTVPPGGYGELLNTYINDYWEHTWTFPVMDLETLADHPYLLPGLTARMAEWADWDYPNKGRRTPWLMPSLRQGYSVAKRWQIHPRMFNGKMVQMEMLTEPAMAKLENPPPGVPPLTWSDKLLVPWNRAAIHSQKALGFVEACNLIHAAQYAFQAAYLFMQIMRLDAEAGGLEKYTEPKMEEGYWDITRGPGGARELLDNLHFLPRDGFKRTELVTPIVWVIYGRKLGQYKDFFEDFERSVYTREVTAIRMPMYRKPVGWRELEPWEDVIRREMPQNLQQQLEPAAIDAYIERVTKFQPTYARNAAALVLENLQVVSSSADIPAKDRNTAIKGAFDSLHKLIALSITWLRDELPFEYYPRLDREDGGYLKPDVTEEELKKRNDTDLAWRLATLGRRPEQKADIFVELLEIWHHPHKKRLDNCLMIRTRLDEIWILLYHFYDWMVDEDVDRDPNGEMHSAWKQYAKKLRPAWNSTRTAIQLTNGRKLPNGTPDPKAPGGQEVLDGQTDKQNSLPPPPPPPESPSPPSSPIQSLSLYEEAEIQPRFVSPAEHRRRQEIQQEQDEAAASFAAGRRAQAIIPPGAKQLKRKHYNIISFMLNVEGAPRSVPLHENKVDQAVMATGLVGPWVGIGGSERYYPALSDGKRAIYHGPHSKDGNRFKEGALKALGDQFKEKQKWHIGMFRCGDIYIQAPEEELQQYGIVLPPSLIVPSSP
ncbi:hypothetical protein OQA88_9924 [Cercophora sp. LCS_1]